jgi:ADP-ribose pyrophosphatase
MTDSVQSELTHRGRLITVEVRRFRDEEGRAVEREIVHHPGGVAIVPVLDGDRIVLIRNDRIAVDDRLWELPAGTLEAGEATDIAAARELEEETGYRAGRMTPVGEFYASPGFLDELVRVFAAEDLQFVGQRLEAGEDIEVVVLRRTEILEMITDGRIRDAKTIAGLLMWERGREAAAP